MDPSAEGEGNLLEIMDLARTLRQEQLFIQHEQASFANLVETLSSSSSAITKLGYICAQQRQNLNNLIISRPGAGPVSCCRRASNLENAKFVDAKKVMDYEHAILYEELFNHLYRSPYLLALSLSTADRIPGITPQHTSSIIHTVTAGLYGNAINTKDIEMLLKLLRELIEIQIVVNENPRRLLRAHSSAFARLYQRLNESMFSAKIFLTSALFEPIMKVLIDNDIMLDVDPNKVIQNLPPKERLKRFGEESSTNYREKIKQFHNNCISKLHSLANSFVESLTCSWSLFPSTLRWLVQTMYHHLKQAHFTEKIINEIVTDMVFTHFICPAIVSPDILGIIDAPISDQVRFNLIQIGQIIQMLSLAKHDEIDSKFAEVYAKFDNNLVTELIDLLLVSRSGEDVVAILSQQSDFERSHLLSTQSELNYFVDFFQTLLASDEYDIPREDRNKLDKILSHLPAYSNNVDVSRGGGGSSNTNSPSHSRERSKQGLISLGKATKSKIAKSISFSATTVGTQANTPGGAQGSVNTMVNGHHIGASAPVSFTDGSHITHSSVASNASSNSISLSPTRSLQNSDCNTNEPILIFNIYNSDENKLQPLTEEEVLKMNSIGQEMANGAAELGGGDAESCNMDNNNDKSSVVFDGIDNMSDDVLRPLHAKQTRFSISHDDASIGNSDILEAVSEAPSNHSVTSSLELEENDQNDNLSDMVSANVSGRGTPNISGRDTPSSQVTDGESVHNVLPTPQMQKLLSKARSDIEDKFCKFEIKKQIEGDETVSILSDTWSTDVLASDSETFDANERDRERNFSTPLIPSSVVLPGDNNYDVMAGSGSGRAGYIDAGDQHSESNWSTDVLVSDSEKIGETDADDILNLTSRSDLTDVDVQSETRREMPSATPDASIETENTFATRSDRSGDNSQKSTRNNNAYNTVGPTHDDSHGADSPGDDSDRSQEDSAFFDAVNSYEDGATTSNDAGASKITSAPPQNYERLSSLARSSVRTTNQITGENSFQQDYKSTRCNREKMHVAYLASMPRINRQPSAESSISNKSAILEDPNGTRSEIAACGDLKTKPNKHLRCDNDSKDLIDFSDIGEDKEAPPTIDGENCAPTTTVANTANEENCVIRRSVSMEQRSAVIDGRRNGILPVKGATHSAPTTSRRHQSLNYENHEIIITNVPKRISMLPALKNYTPETDDFKNEHRKKQQSEEIILIAKTEQLHLNESTREAVSTAPTTTSAADVSPLGVGQKAKSTGAIPKSISFDATADKNSDNNTSPRLSLSHRLHLDSYNSPSMHHNSTNRSGIFNKLKQGFFKNRRNNKPGLHHSPNISEEYLSPIHNMRTSLKNNPGMDLAIGGISGITSAEPGSAGRNRNITATFCDINEDILAKYRRKVSTSSETTNSDSVGNSCHGARKPAEIDNTRIGAATYNDKATVFNNIKKKIRTVLSRTDLHTADFRHTTCSKASPLLTYLQIQSAQAMNMQNFHQISYVSEAIRCLSELEPQQHQQLLEELQTDYEKRQNYLQYLMRHRQNLLLIMENIEQFESRLRSESSTCNRHLMAICVRLFLEKRESKILNFQEEFQRLTVSDDKIDFIEEFMDGFIEELLGADGFLYGTASTEWQIHEARDSIERILLQRMYQQVMFPNDDADLLRDSVLSEHIVKLQRIIHPLHPALSIPQEYLPEAPWLFAQQQISFISAYITPREKLQCVIRCISSIMSLLHMSSGRVPAADDLLPVLIYVVIMANPPYLLSTVEYITCFIGDKLAGEEQFHWTLFESVVKFIKTMDYLD